MGYNPEYKKGIIMDAYQYEKEIKKAKALQREINTNEQERVIGNVITLPIRAAGWVIKTLIKLAIILLIIGFITAVVMFIKTGDLSFLESWR